MEISFPVNAWLLEILSVHGCMRKKIHDNKRFPERFNMFNNNDLYLVEVSEL